MTGLKYVVMWVIYMYVGLIKKKKESKTLRLFIYLAKDVHYIASCLGGQEISAGQAI